MILTIPLILFTYLFLLFNSARKMITKKENFQIHFLLPVFLIIMTSFMGVIIGLGKPKVELFIGIAALFFLFSLNLIFTRNFGLIGAAYSLLITMFLTALISGIYVHHKLSFTLPFNSLLNIIFASAFIFLLGLIWKSSGFWLIVQYSVLIIVYLFILFLFREFNPEDFDFIKRILKFN